MDIGVIILGFFILSLVLVIVIVDLSIVFTFYDELFFFAFWFVIIVLIFCVVLLIGWWIGDLFWLELLLLKILREVRLVFERKGNNIFK